MGYHAFSKKFFNEIINTAQPGQKYPQKFYAVDYRNVDWGQYDIVISVDIAIPRKIVKRFKSTLWAYYIGEGFEPSFYKSLKKPLANYDCFLTQDFQQKVPAYKSHVIELPYNLQYYPCYEDLIGKKINDHERKGIFCESYSIYTLSTEQKNVLKQFGPLLHDKKSDFHAMYFPDMISCLMQAKYFVMFTPPTLCMRTSFLGNAIAEAIAAGALVLGFKSCFTNNDIFNKTTDINSFEDLLEKITFFENNPDVFENELKNQRKLCNYLCYERPIAELFKKCAAKQKKYKPRKYRTKKR